jgi:HSP20 family protein
MQDVPPCIVRLPLTEVKKMDFRNLIPWNRDRSAPVVRQREEDNPVFALHRDMNRVVDDFSRSFDLPTRF